VKAVPLRTKQSQRAGRGAAVPILDLALGGVGGRRLSPFTPGNDQAPTLQEAGRASRPVWTGPENVAPNGVRDPDLSGRSESLYPLRHIQV
jgi:hypothetical protein